MGIEEEKSNPQNCNGHEITRHVRELGECLKANFGKSAQITILGDGTVNLDISNVNPTRITAASAQILAAEGLENWLAPALGTETVDL